MLCCHNFPDIGCFSNFTFTDTHTSLLNLNLSFLHYFIPTLQNFTEEKKVREILKFLLVMLPTVHCLSILHLPPIMQGFMFTCHLSPLWTLPLIPTGNPPRDPHFDCNLSLHWWARKEVTGSDAIWLCPMGLSLFPGSPWWKLCISLPAYWMCWKKRISAGKIKSKTQAYGKVLGMWGLTISLKLHWREPRIAGLIQFCRDGPQLWRSGVFPLSNEQPLFQPWVFARFTWSIHVIHNYKVRL